MHGVDRTSVGKKRGCVAKRVPKEAGPGDLWRSGGLMQVHAKVHLVSGLAGPAGRGGSAENEAEWVQRAHGSAGMRACRFAGWEALQCALHGRQALG